MYQGPSPIFDVPEFPPLRRVKPLPKRRRTSINVSLDGASQMVDMNTGMSLGMNMNMAMAMGMGMNIGMGMVGSMSDLLEYQRGMIASTAGTAPTVHGNLNPASLPSVASTPTPASTPSGTIPTSSTTSSPNSPSSTQPFTPSSFPSYYMPMSMSVPLSMSMFNNVGMGMQDLFRMGLGSIGSIMSGGNISGSITPTTTNSNGTSDAQTTTASSLSQIPISLPLPLQHPLSMTEYPGGFAIPVGPTDEDDHGDGDYVDHLQHPGNTKKRKVPAANGHGHSSNHGGSHGGHASSMNIAGGNQTYVYPYGYTHQLGEVGDEDPGGDGDGSHPSTPQQTQAQNQGQGTTPTSNVTTLPSTPGGGGSGGGQALVPTPFIIHKNKVSPATLAGLQHKELLKTRKRQLAAVLGALSHGDTLALDQALSARYIGVGMGAGGTEEKKGMGITSGTGKENLSLSISAGGHTNEREKRRRSARKTFGEGGHNTSPSPRATPDVRGLPLGVIDANMESSVGSNDTTSEQNGTNAVVLRRTLLPSDSFTFMCPSPTSDRLVSTREEVAILHTRFEAELSRQAAKAAEAATARQQAQAQAQAQHQASSNTHEQGRGSKRVAGRNSGNSAINTGGNIHGNGNANANGNPTMKSHANSNNTANIGQDASTLTSTAAAAPPPPSHKGRTKNKKRSALANASNPHHLRNYVPSRLPYSSSVGYGSGGGHGSGGYGYTLGPPALGLLSPLPVRFLTAQITSDPKTKGRRKSRNTNGNSHSTPTPANGGGRDSPESPRTSVVSGNNNTAFSASHSTIPLTLPEDEWICPLCEYYLFYGDDAAFRRAIKWRKKILNRRRRARERAAAAASGTRLAGAKGGNSGGNVNASNNNITNEGDEYDDSSNPDGEGEEYFEDGEHMIDQEYHEHFRDREKDGVGGAEHQFGHGQKIKK
ncbi:hypothetical protein Clacol_005681 [Clathrus columnatus]|uniref:Uncharacterized protein n=1 Tax=Clathrus columnatus TaxID=1419009 RepID=A0AAV5AD91_9AGAM|nr:hypothetical protein Clacol_005681 [Clathrus columnatus]